MDDKAEKYEAKISENGTNQKVPYQERKTNSSEIITISKEDLEKITGLQQGYNEITVDFGSLKVEKIQIQTAWAEVLKREQELTQKYLQLQEHEKDIAAAFATKYGQGRLDITSGEFIKKPTV